MAGQQGFADDYERFTKDMFYLRLVTPNTGYPSTSFKSDYVICAADYHHFDQNILPKEYSNYSKEYWDSRSMSPSCLIYYLGVGKRLDLEHHNYFCQIELYVRQSYLMIFE